MVVGLYTLTVLAQKGGAGKTTIAINLSISILRLLQTDNMKRRMNRLHLNPDEAATLILG